MSSELVPLNNYLVVEPITEERKESGVLLPEDYTGKVSSHCLARLLVVPKKSTLPVGCKLIAPAHMIEEIELFGEKYHVVLENHVVGFFKD